MLKLKTPNTKSLVADFGSKRGVFFRKGWSTCWWGLFQVGKTWHVLWVALTGISAKVSCQCLMVMSDGSCLLFCFPLIGNSLERNEAKCNKIHNSWVNECHELLLLVACKPYASQKAEVTENHENTFVMQEFFMEFLVVNFLKMVPVLLIRQTKSNEPVGVINLGQNWPWNLAKNPSVSGHWLEISMTNQFFNGPV